MKEISKVFNKGSVLLVRGPASIKVIKGKVSCLSNFISYSPVIVRKGKVLPLECEDDICEVSILASDNSYVEVASSNYGTYIWKHYVENILENLGGKYKKIVIIGATDAGKSTFSVYLINLALSKNLLPGIIDADVGQSDLTPPSFIGCKKIKKQIFDLRDEKADYTLAIGVIDSFHFNDLIINVIKKEFELLQDANIIIINTDGFVVDKGLENKISLINQINPDLIFILGNTELFSKIIELYKEKCMILPRSDIIRDRNERAERREIQYQKYLIDSKKKIINLTNLKIGLFGRIYEKTLVEKDTVTMFSKDNYALKIFPSKYEMFIINSMEKTTFITNESLRGMFVGLSEDEFIIGFGVIESFNGSKIRILTNFDGKFDCIWLTTIRITKTGEQKISLRFI